MEQNNGPKFSKPRFVQPGESMVPPGSPQELIVEEEAPALSAEVVDGKEVRTPNSQKKSQTPLQDSLRRLRKDFRAMFCLGVIAFYVLLAIFGPPIYRMAGPDYKSNMTNTVIPASVYRDFTHQEADRKHEGPSAQYWLGTDSIGRDLFARLMQGMLISIAVAAVVELIDIFLGVTVGVLAGYYGGWIDFVLARFTDVIFAFPGLLFIILLVGILGSKANDTLGNIPVIGANGNARLLFVSIGLALTVWPLMARYVRGQTLQLKEQQFVEAARTSGATDFTIIVRHLIPNLFSIVIIASTLNIANTIISEAGISLLGLGVQPPGSSIGLMISDATTFLENHPWEALMPSFVLVIIVLAFSFLGDGLRDAFDPRSKD
ncbi:glutathione transport system permease protein GsiD [Dictyobacter vulcani]|uniref:Glutathione transport system permease protein GsiD n=1 Tax=Dictyobacter vulcani TaxID=2607529 RepID=A0A5J4KH05_9CHLR|nr:ABC transporter permease [Dictyobacter vulcani]GER88744.1 glutathione transport system permease protein GsiD [Dictyobacter vulcani]